MKRQRENGKFKFDLPRRLLVFFLALIIVPYTIGMIFAQQMAQKAIPGAEETYSTRLETLSDQLDTELSRIESQMYYNAQRMPVQFMSLVTSSFSFADIYSNVVSTRDIIYALHNSSGLLERTTVYFPQIERKISSEGSFVHFSQSDETFLESYSQSGGLNILMSINGELCMVCDSLRMVGMVRKEYSGEAAVFRLELSDKALAKWCNVFSDEGQVCLISTQKGSQTYFLNVGNGPYESDVLRDNMSHAIEDQSSEDSSVDIISLSNTQTLRIISQVGQRQLWIACYMDSAVIKSAANSFMMWQAVFTAFLLLEIGVFFYLMRRMVARPINRFASEVMRLEKEGILQLAEKPDGDMDFLYEAFLEMSSKLKQVLEQSYKNKVLIYQSEIKYLQAQVNPHFLYNSFYHLYRMAKMEDNDGVAEMSSRLSSYYRYITRSDQNEVPLEMEYQNIVDYTEIQTIRFGTRINVELEPLPDKFKYLIVPRFVLQPLFENAYYHGVEKMTAGHIRLKFIQKQANLIILVENNGACSDEELSGLKQYLERNEEGEKITALKNVKGRMKLLGGELNISRGSLGGFCAELILPYTEKKEEEYNDEDIADC